MLTQPRAGDIFFTSIVNVILIMRLYAMYGNRKGRGDDVYAQCFLCELRMHRVYSINILRLTVPLYVPSTLHPIKN